MTPRSHMPSTLCAVEPDIFVLGQHEVQVPLSNKVWYGLGEPQGVRFVDRTPLVKIILEDGSSFYATPEHEVFMFNGDTVKAKDLQPGHDVFGRNSLGGRISSRVRKIENLPLADPK